VISHGRIKERQKNSKSYQVVVKLNKNLRSLVICQYGKIIIQHIKRQGLIMQLAHHVVKYMKLRASLWRFYIPLCSDH